MLRDADGAGANRAAHGPHVAIPAGQPVSAPPPCFSLNFLSRVSCRCCKVPPTHKKRANAHDQTHTYVHAATYNICNRLSDLPSEIGLLTQLNTLACHNNRLKYIPREIGFCASLQVCAHAHVCVCPWLRRWVVASVLLCVNEFNLHEVSCVQCIVHTTTYIYTYLYIYTYIYIHKYI